MNGRGRPAQAASTDDTRAKRITPAQARTELARRRLPKDRRHEGRAEAMECGAFYVSGEALKSIAEGGS